MALFLPLVAGLHAKRSLRVDLRRGKPWHSGTNRAGAGCPARWPLRTGPLVLAWQAGSFKTALSGLRTRSAPMTGEKNRKGGLRQAAGPGEWLRFAVMRGSAALPAVVPARTRDRNGLVPAHGSAATGRGPAGQREPGHRRSASAPRPLLLLLLPPGHLLRAVPRRAAPATCTPPQAPATHRNYRPPVPPFSGFLPSNGGADGSGARSGRS